jgi:hypothetical protein
MTPLFRVLILLMTLFCILLATGCAAGDCPVQTQTTIVSKISQNGTLLWTQVLDTGIMNRISNILPLHDGDIVTAGWLSTKSSYCSQEYKARIVRFSDTGNVTWNRLFETENSDKTIQNVFITSKIGKASTITSTNDGGFVTVFNTGEIYKLDQDGNKVWSRNIGNSSDYLSAIKTDDGGITITKPVFMKLDRNGTILWQRSFPNSSFIEMNSVAILENYRGFVLEYVIRDPIVWNNYTIVLSQTDSEGNFINSTFIPEKNIYLLPIFTKTPEGYLIFLSSEEFSGGKTGILRFNPDGTYVHRQSINASFPIILTKDTGYLNTEIENRSVHVVKLNQSESKEWDITIPVKNPQFEVFAETIIQTSDGGYIINYGSWGQVDLSK